jgi:hypothetical protein
MSRWVGSDMVSARSSGARPVLINSRPRCNEKSIAASPLGTLSRTINPIVPHPTPACARPKNRLSGCCQGDILAFSLKFGVSLPSDLIFRLARRCDWLTCKVKLRIGSHYLIIVLTNPRYAIVPIVCYLSGEELSCMKIVRVENFNRC